MQIKINTKLIDVVHIPVIRLVPNSIIKPIIKATEAALPISAKIEFIVFNFLDFGSSLIN
jgi:uncharacterized protein YqfA (UPF0365 family)